MQPDVIQDDLSFLDKYDVELRADIKEAERQLAYSPHKPYHSTVECRRFLERLGNCIADRHGLARRIKTEDSEEQLGSFIWRLSKAKKVGFRARQIQCANQIRKAGNGVHIDVLVEQRDARRAIENCKELARWFEDNSTTTAQPHTATANSGAARPSTPPPKLDPKVVPFPTRESNSARPAQERASPPPLDQYQRSDTEIAEEPHRFGGVLACVAGLAIATLVGWYFWIHRPPIGAGIHPVPFAQAEAYTVVPGGDAPHVNERGGPGTNYPILSQIDRGATISGIARATDADNVSWVELADGRGYVKETLLAPVAAAPPPAPIAAQNNSAVTPPSAVIPLPVPPASQAASNSSVSEGGSTEGQGSAEHQSPPASAAGASAGAPALFHFTFGGLGNRYDAPRGAFSRPSNGRVYRPAPRR